jgi:hypothetical protein
VAQCVGLVVETLFLWHQSMYSDASLLRISSVSVSQVNMSQFQCSCNHPCRITSVFWKTFTVNWCLMCEMNTNNMFITLLAFIVSKTFSLLSVVVVVYVSIFIIKYPAFCSQMVFVRFLWFSKWTAIVFINFNNIWGYGLDSSFLSQELVTCSCEYSYVPTDSIKGGITRRQTLSPAP